MAEVALPAVAFIGFVCLQRLAELALARRNTARLMRRGAREVGAGHYPAIVAVHALWLGAVAVFGVAQPVSLAWLTVYAALQFVRAWILASLGERWTTRIIVLDEPLVRAGPFALLRHPNYVLVAAEIVVVPMALGLVWIALVFTALNAAALAVRVRVEEEALRR